MDTIQAYSYVRCSTKEQLHGDTLRRQVQKTEEYCKRRGWVLDATLQPQDLGIPAYHGRNRTHGALAGFLKLCGTPRVPRGSVLIVESLDRLSRQEIDDADQLICGILRKGIGIVTLKPERELTPKSVNDLLARIELLVLASRANEESATKSARIKEERAAKVQRTRKTKAAMGGSCPSWLQLVDVKRDASGRLLGGRWEKIDDRVAVVKRLCKLALDGYGMDTIARKVNADGITTLGKGKTWAASSIRSVVRSRALIGEYQPQQMTPDGKKQIAGDPIESYYPPVMTKKDFFRMQSAIDSRLNARGRRGHQVRNLFQGLLTDLGGSSLIIVSQNARPYLVSSAAKRGIPGNKYISFKYATFEKYFLRLVKQLKAADLLPQQVEDTEDVVGKLEGELADKDNRITTIKKRITTDQDFVGLLDVLKELQAQRDDLLHQLDKARQATHQETVKDTLKDTKSVAALLAESEDPTDLRTRLRGQIRRLVASITCQPSVASMDGMEYRICVADIHFRAGGQRILLTAYRRGEELWESWTSEEGVHVHTPDTLVARLGLLPKNG